MENNNELNAVRNNADQQYDWQNAEKKDNQWQAGTSEGVDLRSAEAGGYGIDNHDTYFASGDDQSKPSDEDDDEDDNDLEDDDTDDDDTDDDDASSDWGDVDPQSGGVPTGNEPTAPGSAV